MTDPDRLRRGDRFRLGTIRYRVEYVNESRAQCARVGGERVTIRDATGVTRTFTAPGRAIDISPHSFVEVERKGGREWNG